MEIITYPINLKTSSGLYFILNGFISLPDVTSLILLSVSDGQKTESSKDASFIGI